MSKANASPRATSKVRARGPLNQYRTRELSEKHRAMRRSLLWLAAGAASSVTTGFLGVALGFGEGVFFAFATIAMALAGLAILFVEHITVAREEAEEPEIVFWPIRIKRSPPLASIDASWIDARREARRRVEHGISTRNEECST